MQTMPRSSAVRALAVALGALLAVAVHRSPKHFHHQHRHHFHPVQNHQLHQRVRGFLQDQHRPAQTAFVGGAAISMAAASPTLAPAPKTKENPGLPMGIDKERFGEKVRWLMDEEIEKPPDWRVLLLDKTFKSTENTVVRVAACLVAVLGLATGAARGKAQHAHDNFFSVVDTTPEFNEAVRKAKALQSKGLVVRVTPGVSLPEYDGDSVENAAGGQSAGSGLA
mmetsp:Transcript_17958/g.38294  ORF Transcript_17958/g.38294 Transcript_17958/m.38294 type:complete len:224 (+) Transcript_17958:70-741(+)